MKGWSEMEISNARIKSTELRLDGDIPTFYVFVEGNGWGCGIGGYSLVGYDTDPPTWGTVEALAQICKAVGVDNWEDLPGKYCRVKKDYQTVSVIGNIIKDDWFDLKEFYGGKG